LILDFVNKTEVIQKSFQPYYERTYLKEGTDPHKLYDLEEKLLDYQVFDQSDVETFIKTYKKGESQPKLHNLLSPVVEEFRKKSKKEQVGFKKTLKRYQNIYSFLSQLIPFSDVNLEKMYWFNKFLSKKLPTINNPLPFNVLEDVDIGSYEPISKGQKEIKLQSEGELKPISAGAGEYVPDINAKLSKILKDINDAFGTDFTDDNKVFLSIVKDKLSKNEKLQNQMERNSKENVKAVFDGYFNEEMNTLLNSNMDLFKKLVDNEKLKTKIKSALFDLVYSEFDKKKNYFGLPEKSKKV